MEGVLGLKIPLQFHTFIIENLDFHPRHQQIFIWGPGICLQKTTITRHWLLTSSPTVKKKIAFSLHLQMNRFTKLWSKWIAYVWQSRPHFMEKLYPSLTIMLFFSLFFLSALFYCQVLSCENLIHNSTVQENGYLVSFPTYCVTD